MSRTLYNCRTAASGWMMAKFDPDFNVAAVYTITTRDEKPQMACDCPGWPRKSICKHTRMVSTFALAGAIDTSQFYCYETQTWHQPIQAFSTGENDPTAEKAANIPEIATYRELGPGEDVATEFAKLIVPAGPTTLPTPYPTTVPPTQFRRRV